jgi:hypothetical protein
MPSADGWNNNDNNSNDNNNKCVLILVNDQLDALFSMCLFHASTYFEQQMFIIRRIKLFSLPTGTQDSHPLGCIIPDDVLKQFGPPDDEHLLLETSRGVK